MTKPTTRCAGDHETCPTHASDCFQCRIDEGKVERARQMNWHSISSYLANHWQTILFYAVFSIAIPIFVAWLTIRFGPNRKEVSRLSRAIDKMAEDRHKEKRAGHFRCDARFIDLQEKGSRLIFKAPDQFRLIQVALANGNGAPVASVTVDSKTSTEHTCELPYSAINRAYWSTPGGNTKDGVLLYSVEIDGVLVERKIGVVLNQGFYSKPPDTTQHSYVFMS